VRSHPIVETYARHVSPEFVKLLGVFGYGRVLVRAEDVWVWDEEGRRYLDLLAGFGSVNIGHNHPRLRKRLHGFLDEKPLNLVHVGPSDPAAELARTLAALAGDPLEIVLFSNGGAEAVEAGMKVAKAATGRSALLSCREGFHGTSLGALSILGDERMRSPFLPLLPGCTLVPFGNRAALERELSTGKFAAFVVEPIPAEGGVLIPPAGYLAWAQEACRRHGTLLVLDEVQTGLGRTGEMFAFQHEGFTPDVLVLAKALGGSIASIGATLVSRQVHSAAYGSMARFDLHGSTFGGNSFAAVAALETLAIVESEKLVHRSRELGAEFLGTLRTRLGGHPFVKEVRGRGLLVAVELGGTDSTWLGRAAPRLVDGFAELVFGQWAAVRLLEKGIICQPASRKWNVLKLEPPLTIGSADLSAAADAIVEVLGDYEGAATLVSDVSRRLGAQLLSGGDFR